MVETTNNILNDELNENNLEIHDKISYDKYMGKGYFSVDEEFEFFLKERERELKESKIIVGRQYTLTKKKSR